MLLYNPDKMDRDSLFRKYAMLARPYRVAMCYSVTRRKGVFTLSLNEKFYDELYHMVLLSPGERLWNVRPIIWLV